MPEWLLPRRREANLGSPSPPGLAAILKDGLPPPPPRPTVRRMSPSPGGMPRYQIKAAARNHAPLHRIPAEAGSTMVTDMNEYLALFRRQTLDVSGEVYCKVSKLFRSKKYFAELKGCNLVIYKTAETVGKIHVESDDIVAVLVVSEYSIEIVYSGESANIARIFIVPSSSNYYTGHRDPFHSLYIKVAKDSQEFDQWKAFLSRANAMKLPNLFNMSIKSIIGQGGGGKVFMVKWKEAFYALKVIDKRKTFSSNRAMHHVSSERYLMEKVGYHPYLLRMEFAFQTQSNLFIGTSLCEGGDLATYIRKHGLKMTSELSNLYAPECVADTVDSVTGVLKKRKKYYGRLSEEAAKGIGAEILLGLKHLHKRGIVYRDLKPENILITKEGRIKIGDFGLSKNLHLNNSGSKYLRTGSVCGTRNYLPPEMLYGKPYSMEADMWSFGVMLYRVICGCFPFDAARTKEVFKLVRNSHPLLPAVLTPEARSLLGKLLSKSPEDRLNIDGAMNHPFFSSVDFEKVLVGDNNPSLPNVASHTEGNSPLDVLENFEISRLQGVTMGELGAVFDGNKTAGNTDNEGGTYNALPFNDSSYPCSIQPMTPKGRLIGFEYYCTEDDANGNGEETGPASIEVTTKKTPSFFARIVSIDSEALLSPRRTTQANFS